MIQRLISSAFGEGFEPAVSFERRRGDETPFAEVRVQASVGGARVHVVDQGEHLGDQGPGAELAVRPRPDVAMAECAVNAKVYQSELACGALFTSISGDALLASFELVQPLATLDRGTAECYAEPYQQ